MSSKINKSSKSVNSNNRVIAKKKYGQNFLQDENVLNNIIDCSNLTKDVAVIEIGPGLGALTKKLCEAAGFVLAYEIDTDLIPILTNNLSEYNNYEIVNNDILKVDINDDINTKLTKYKYIYLVANLPYYITTPIILGLLSKTLKITKYVIMVQLEVAQRICGKPKTKDYNALSIVIGYKAKAKKEFNVSKNAFYPVPKVDSAVISINLYDKPLYDIKDEELFLKLIRLAFNQRRKTLLNNLINKYDRSLIIQCFNELRFKEDIRAEELSILDFVNLSNCITHLV